MAGPTPGAVQVKSNSNCNGTHQLTAAVGPNFCSPLRGHSEALPPSQTAANARLLCVTVDGNTLFNCHRAGFRLRRSFMQAGSKLGAEQQDHR